MIRGTWILLGLGFGQDVVGKGVGGAQPQVGLGVGLCRWVGGQFREAVGYKQRTARVAYGAGWALGAWRALPDLCDNSYRALFDFCDDGGWQAFARVNNVFDRRYASAGVLAENPFVGGAFQANPDNWRRESFVAPGAPRAAWVGVRYLFGGR